MSAQFNRLSNHKLWGDWKSKATRPYSIQILIQLFAKNLFDEVENHALIGSKLSKEEVQLIRIAIFKK